MQEVLHKIAVAADYTKTIFTTAPTSQNTPALLCHISPQSVMARVHNIIEEESILLSISLYKRILQSISAFHRLLP